MSDRTAAEAARMARPETDDWLSIPVGVGLAVASAVATILGIALPTRSDGIEVAALALTLVYAIYLGFVLTRGGAVELLIEGAFLGVGLVLIGLGVWASPGWLSVGFLLHGFWDLLHHRDRHVLGVRGVPRWYVPACAVYDWTVGTATIAILR